jgi:SAM-dependent methyltransferase
MQTWDYYGRQDPYYGVMTSAEYRSGRMDEAARQRFFATGAAQVDQFIELVESTFGRLTRRGTALDFGCGVGRLSRRLVELFERVVAVDISEGMLAEAGRNLKDFNVTFEIAGTSTAPVDFILSKIVIQHIPPEQGKQSIQLLAARLSPGGCGVFDIPIRYTGGPLRQFLRTARGLLPRGEPIIPMYTYDLREVQQLLEAAGCEVRSQKVETDRFEKAILVFRKK